MSRFVAVIQAITLKRVEPVGKAVVPSLAIVAALLQGGCSTFHAYDGESRSRDDVAHIAGDWRLSAGAPLSIFLRQVDDLDVSSRYIAVDLLPGEHRLLVDCTVNATKHTSRHVLNVDVGQGRYKLVADTLPGNRECGDVSLVQTD
jgi:hypothetical protein